MGAPNNLPIPTDDEQSKTVGFLIPSRKRDWGVATSEVDVETKAESGHYPLIH